MWVYGSPREVIMRDYEPTVRSRELGEGLRRAMEQARFNGRQAAHQLGWSPSWVSRLLSGKRGGSALDVADQRLSSDVGPRSVADRGLRVP